MSLIVVHLLFLHALEGAHALHHLVPVDQVTVEFRSVDTHELCLASDSESTGTTHAGAVDHDGVERHIVGDTIFMGEERGELHHHGRADCQHLVDMLALDDFLHTDGDHAFLAVAAVIGHDDHLVAVFLDVIDHDDKILRASGQH